MAECCAFFCNVRWSPFDCSLFGCHCPTSSCLHMTATYSDCHHYHHCHNCHHCHFPTSSWITYDCYLFRLPSLSASPIFSPLKSISSFIWNLISKLNILSFLCYDILPPAFIWPLLFSDCHHYPHFCSIKTSSTPSSNQQHFNWLQCPFHNIFPLKSISNLLWNLISKKKIVFSNFVIHLYQHENI